MQPLKVLLVDDSATGRLQVGDMLEELGHRALAAAHGREALELLEGRAVDLMLCDLVMPEMDGLEVLREVRAKRPELPFILVTAHATLESALEALRLGANDYLMRPVSLDTLAHRLGSVVDRMALEKEREHARQLEAALATAGAAAHELNQPLTALMASAELIGSQKDPARILALAALVAEQAKRVGKVTHRLTNLVRYQTMPYVGDQYIVDLEASSRDD